MIAMLRLFVFNLAFWYRTGRARRRNPPLAVDMLRVNRENR